MMQESPALHYVQLSGKRFCDSPVVVIVHLVDQFTLFSQM